MLICSSPGFRIVVPVYRHEAIRWRPLALPNAAEAGAQVKPCTER